MLSHCSLDCCSVLVVCEISASLIFANHSLSCFKVPPWATNNLPMRGIFPSPNVALSGAIDTSFVLKSSRLKSDPSLPSILSS